MLQQLISRDRIELATAADFCIGDIRVEPARLTLQRHDAIISVEPRVMMVLVALAQAEGRVVSRDELVDRCWEGRIVGDNAIHRIVSRLRHLSQTLGGFDIQTVTKVGYLLRPVGDETAVHVAEPQTLLPTAEAPIAGKAPAKSVSRRWLIGGLGVVAVGAGGAAAWRSFQPQDPNFKAADALVAKAREAQLMDLTEQTDQAIAYLKRATELNPRSSEAWGLLALSYEQLLADSEPAELPVVADWSRTAARNALALDAGNVEAKVALATIRPNFRNWVENEARLRALKATHGEHPALDGALGWMLCDVGRWSEAIACFRRALAPEPYHIGNQLILGRALWGKGQLAEADEIFGNALKLWPRHRRVWRMRFDFLATTGRPGAALGLINDQAARPLVAPGDRPPPYDALLAFATALQSRLPADVARAAAYIGTGPEPGPLGHHGIYPMALGRIAEVFAWSEAFYFGAPGVPPPSPLSRRKTSFLFYSLATPLRSRPEYRPLLQRLGLFDYWSRTGTRPDFPV